MQLCITSATSVRLASLECAGRPRQGGRSMPRRSLQESGRLDRPGSSRTPLAPSSVGSAPVVLHVAHPVTADEIVAPASPAPRRLMPRLAGRRSRRRGDRSRRASSGPGAGRESALTTAARRSGLSEQEVLDLPLARLAWRSMVAVRLLHRAPAWTRSWYSAARRCQST